MKLKAFTKPISQTAVTRASAASAAAGRCRGVMSSAATPALPTHWSSRRRTAVSPRRSSTNPRAPKKPIAAPNGTAALPRTRTTATSSPTTIGSPPPRGVGTVCDERAPGVSIASRRSRGIVSGSATMTTMPQHSTARVISSPHTEWMLPGQ